MDGFTLASCITSCVDSFYYDFILCTSHAKLSHNVGFGAGWVLLFLCLQMSAWSIFCVLRNSEGVILLHQLSPNLEIFELKICTAA